MGHANEQWSCYCKQLKIQTDLSQHTFQFTHNAGSVETWEIDFLNGRVKHVESGLCVTHVANSFYMRECSANRDDQVFRIGVAIGGGGAERRLEIKT